MPETNTLTNTPAPDVPPHSHVEDAAESTKLIAELTELTDNLPELDSIESVFGPIVLQHAPDRQSGPQFSYGYSAFRDDDISLMRFFIGEGHDIPRHINRGGHQWIGIIRGTLEIITSEGTTLLSQYGLTHVAPNTPFAIHAVTDVWFWAITAPPSPGSPATATTTPFERG